VSLTGLLKKIDERVHTFRRHYIHYPVDPPTRLLASVALPTVSILRSSTGCTMSAYRLIDRLVARPSRVSITLLGLKHAPHLGKYEIALKGCQHNSPAPVWHHLRLTPNEEEYGNGNGNKPKGNGRDRPVKARVR
jgi:hypothetical protein